MTGIKYLEDWTFTKIKNSKSENYFGYKVVFELTARGNCFVITNLKRIELIKEGSRSISDKKDKKRYKIKIASLFYHKQILKNSLLQIQHKK